LAISNSSPNRCQHRIGILQNLIIPEAQHLETLTLQPDSTRLVLGILVVLPAVRFDDDSYTEVYKVHHVWPDRLLAAELLIIKAVSAQV